MCVCVSVGSRKHCGVRLGVPKVQKGFERNWGGILCGGNDKGSVAGRCRFWVENQTKWDQYQVVVKNLYSTVMLLRYESWLCHFLIA